MEPDFIVLTDPQFWAYKHIEGIKSPSSILITESAVYPPVFRFPCKKIICCKSNFPLEHFFDSYRKEKGTLVAGGSVASTAWNFAQYSGSTEIYMAGLDLAFPQKQTHIKGSTFEQATHVNSKRISTSETSHMPIIFSGNACYEKNYNNEDVLTDQRMKMFAWWFESRIEQFPNVKTYTFSKEGLYIPGIEYCSIDKLLEKKDITEIKKAFISQEENINATQNNFENAINTFIKEMNKIKENALLLKQQLEKNEINSDNFFDLKNTIKDSNLKHIIKMLSPTKKQIESKNKNNTLNNRIIELTLLIQNIEYCLKKIKK